MRDINWNVGPTVRIKCAFNIGKQTIIGSDFADCLTDKRLDGGEIGNKRTGFT